MPRTTARTLLQLLRAGGAALSLLALGTAAVFCWQPLWIVALDEALVRRCVEDDRQRVVAARKLVAGDLEAGLAALRALWREFRGGLPSEHRGQRRAEAGALLATALVEAGQRDEALLVCRERLQTDPQDLPAQLDLIDLLAGDRNANQEHDQRLRELHVLLPESEAVTGRLLAHLARLRLHAAWGEALEAHLRSARRYAFRVQLDVAGVPQTWLLSEPFQPCCGDDAVLRSDLLLIEGVRGARWLLPPWIVLHEPRLEVPGLGAIPADGTAGGTFETGARPAELAIPLPAPLAAPTAARFVAGVHVAQPPWLREVLLGADAEAALEAMAPGPARDRLRAHRTAAALAEGLALRWRTAGQEFAGERSTIGRLRLGFETARGIPFEVGFALGPGTAEVRLALPNRAGLAFALEAVEPDPGTARPWQPATGEQLRDLRAEGGLLVSTGRQPEVTFALPAGEAPRRLLVRGVLR